MTRLVRVRAHGEVDPVGEPRARRPDLPAVDDEAIPLTHGTRRQRCQVAPGLRLREALAERELPARDRPEELLLQRRRGETLERAADRLVREEVEREREPVVAEDVLDERRIDVRQPTTPDLLRPRHPDPARLSQRTCHVTRVAVREHPLAAPLGVVDENRAQRSRRTPRLRPGARAAPLSVGGPRADDRRAP